MKRKFKILTAAFSALCLAAASYCVFASTFMIDDSYTVVENGSVDNYLPYLISAEPNPSVRVQSSGRLSGGVVESANRSSEVRLKFLGLVPVKTVSVNTVKPPAATISGECIGVKLYADGLITVGVTDFESADGARVSPARDAGVRAGDIIKSVNGAPVSTIAQFLKTIDSEKNCVISVQRDGKNIDFRIYPAPSSDGHRRIGVWVRDSVAGIGTLTFADAQTGKFATLGHGIADADTDVLIPLKSGTLHPATILGITKGKKGVPGEIIGSLSESKTLGKCEKNLETGIYGTLGGNRRGETLQIAPSSEIQKGDAAIVCTIDGEGPKQYSVKILNISRLYGGTKSMIIRITDPHLISKTGGIVQGMSGSPIVQNGKLAGAVTHVFVNDPLKGYAIFAETMLSELSK